MKTRLLSTLVLVLGLAVGFAGLAIAAGPGQVIPAAVPAATSPVTLNMNLGGEPVTLEPALWLDTGSGLVIEQLFAGLVDLDDTTSEVLPELATSWTTSPDGTVYTFTLRSDAVWSDGQPISAQDVRYGILRSLAPATASDSAYILGIIKNAVGYNSGAITDANLVGVTAVNSATLEVRLEYAASYALSILSLPVARPMPQWAIESHGVPTWTEPANIVTSGAYRLTEWAHNDHILLDKNPTYFNAGSVQIDQVTMRMLTDAAAWTLYVNGQLDTAAVPMGTALDPIRRQETRVQPGACTYYYGFSVSQAPFNDPLVRKAFAAATDRQGLINSVTGGVQRPALTFTPPGFFGYVDGAAEGVGIPYNPSQARQWLSDAGYPGGQGLPPVTLWFNTSVGHENIAKYVRNSWYNTLGVSVTLSSLPWTTYLSQLQTGTFPVWRNGWCLDYPDANNFLGDGVIPSSYRAAYGGWTNATYDSLVDQAAREQDPNVRKALYKQAEEILVETDAVMLPLYFYTSVTASKPYLERTYSVGGPDISTWRITLASGTASPATGGTVTSYSGDTTVVIPGGAITETIVITQSPAYGMPPVGDLTGIGHVFDVTAVYSSTGLPAHLAPGQTYTITVHYSDTQKGGAVESTLGLYSWGGAAWSQEGITSTVNITDNLVTAQAPHFSLFALLGETHRVYLPLVIRGY